MLAETLKTYLEVLEIYSEEEVAQACARLTREPREFPPTAGEVRAMCERVVISSTPPRPALTDESRPYVNDLTPEQRAENVRRLRELVAEIGANKKVAPVSQKPPRPAPFNFGPSLMKSLADKGMVKLEETEGDA